MRDFTVNCDIATIFQIVNARNVKDVILHQGEVRGSTVHDRLDVYLNNFTGQVLTLAIKDGTIQESVTGQALGFMDKFADRIQFTAELVDAGTIDSATDFQFVCEAVKDGFGCYNVAVTHCVDAVVHILDRVDLIFLTILTDNTQ